MKKIFISAVLFLTGQFVSAQTEWPREVTPEVLQKIKSGIEKQIPRFKQNLSKENLTADQVEFSLDTFRIEQMVAERMSIDYSTIGMNTTVNERTASYDKLMNKYYNKLLKLLKPESKKILTTAQKNWLAYRDAESKLIWEMTRDEYSGGGSMQSNIATDAYSNLVAKRAIEIFNYYDGIIKDN